MNIALLIEYQALLDFAYLKFFTPSITDSCYWSLDDSKSPQVSKTPNILHYFSYTIVWMISILPLIFSLSCLFSIGGGAFQGLQLWLIFLSHYFTPYEILIPVLVVGTFSSVYKSLQISLASTSLFRFL